MRGCVPSDPPLTQVDFNQDVQRQPALHHRRAGVGRNNLQTEVPVTRKPLVETKQASCPGCCRAWAGCAQQHPVLSLPSSASHGVSEASATVCSLLGPHPAGARDAAWYLNMRRGAEGDGRLGGLQPSPNLVLTLFFPRIVLGMAPCPFLAAAVYLYHSVNLSL